MSRGPLRIRPLQAEALQNLAANEGDVHLLPFSVDGCLVVYANEDEGHEDQERRYEIDVAGAVSGGRNEDGTIGPHHTTDEGVDLA